MQVKGKVAVVTGAAGGIGEAVARRYTKEGARGVVVADMDQGRAEAVARDIGGLAVACDVAKEADVQKLIAAAEAKFGPVDIFFSNAGILRHGHESASDIDWAQSWAVHVMAHVYAARALVPQMLKRGEGYLLNTASAAGLLASMTSAPYGVTKHAGVALAEHLAIQYGDRGIRVSVLCPQAVDTEMIRDAKAAGHAAFRDGLLSSEEVADAAVRGLADGRFLILPHADVLTYFQRKATDYDRWLAGMARLRAKARGDASR